jgi:hypothetical protein
MVNRRRATQSSADRHEKRLLLDLRLNLTLLLVLQVFYSLACCAKLCRR